jgi:hypothetical protein
VTKDERLYLIGDGQAVGRALTRRDLRCISALIQHGNLLIARAHDPQLVPQLPSRRSNQRLCPVAHSHSHRTG